MKQTLLKTIVLGFVAITASSVWAQTTIVVKDQAKFSNSTAATAVYADNSKTVAYTNQDNYIWYLGTYDMSTIDYIEVKGAAFASKSDGTKAQLRISYLAEGTVTDLTATGLSAHSSAIRGNNNLARVVAETTPATMASGKNCTNYPGASFKITATEVTQTGTYDGTCNLDASTSFGIQKTTGTYQLFLYGNASSRRLAVDEVVIHYVNEGNSAVEVAGTVTADTYVRYNNTGTFGSNKKMEIHSEWADNIYTADFVGLMSFSIPSAAVGKITSAELKLVTNVCKGATKMNVYKYDHAFAENAKYADEAEYISASRTNYTPTTFNVAYGVRSNSLEADDISASPTIDKWTNTIGLTSIASAAKASTFQIMIDATATASNSNKNEFFTKEATAVTNTQNNSYTFTAEELQPALSIVYDNTIPTKSYTLDVTAVGAATLVLPYPATIPDDVICYTLHYTSEAASVRATEVTGTLPANTPVLVNAEAGSYIFRATSDVETLKQSTEGALTGVCALTTVPSGSYILTLKDDKVGFRTVDGSTNYVEAYHAYLTADGAGAPEFMGIDFGGSATNIQTVQGERLVDKDSAIYNLNGQRVAQPGKGLYIVNGKKYIIK